MPLDFTCPECREPVRVSEALAGLHTRCPKCSAAIVAPDLSEGGKEAAVTVRPDAPPPREAWEPSPRSRADAYAPPRADDYGLTVRDTAAPAWQTVRMGLHLEFIAVVIMICIYAASLLVQCVGMGGARGFGRGGGEGLALLLAGLGILVLIGAVAALVLMIVARCMCCLAPSSSGTKGLAIGSISCWALAALLLVGILLIALGGRFGSRSETLMAGMAIATLLVAVAAHILFLLFLRGVAAYFGNKSLAARVVAYLVVSLVVPVLMVVGLIALMASTIRFRGGTEVLVIVTVVQAVVTLGLLGWYSNLVAQARDTIGQRPTPERDRYWS